MNEQQFNLLAEKLIKRPEQREAVKLNVIGGMSAYEAEKRVFGRIVGTVSKDANRIWANCDFINEFVRLRTTK